MPGPSRDVHKWKARNLGTFRTYLGKVPRYSIVPSITSAIAQRKAVTAEGVRYLGNDADGAFPLISPSLQLQPDRNCNCDCDCDCDCLLHLRVCQPGGGWQTQPYGCSHLAPPKSIPIPSLAACQSSRFPSVISHTCTFINTTVLHCSLLLGRPPRQNQKNEASQESRWRWRPRQGTRRFGFTKASIVGLQRRHGHGTTRSSPWS